MFAEITSRHLLIREWLNGSLLPLTLNLTLVLFMYMLQNFYEARRDRVSFFKIPGIQTVCVLFWVFLAESIRAGSVWYYLRMQNHGFNPTMEITAILNLVLVIVGIVLISSVLRCTYIFSPPQIRGAFWVYSLSITIVFMLLSHLMR